MIPETHLQAACCDLVADVVRDAGRASLRVTGLSMLPAIRPGDVLSIERVETNRAGANRAGANELRPGQIILYSRNGRLKAHRIVSIRSEYVVTRGDRLLSCDVPVRSSEVIGRVASVRRNGHPVSLEQSFWQRLAALVLRHSECCTKIFLRLSSKLHRPAVIETSFEY